MEPETNLKLNGDTLTFIKGDKFRYPKDRLGITVDYVLTNIIERDDQEDIFEFTPQKETYIWNNQEFKFDIFLLRREQVVNLLWKKIWIQINN